MDANVEQLVLAVLLGGLFGWILGKLPDVWVYAVAGLTIILGVVVVTRATGG